ncbi:hypothetical protein UB32_07990 [Mesobacillus subterraneus]|uniref:Uncharacterized protein n=2 Tax=Mesobacillus subterraneus TaxID=285983 RepID=A0A0D6ZAK7_9BACI|nr:hypothetical protein UB32_07990 [Mesobacillus subterraneus]
MGFDKLQKIRSTKRLRYQLHKLGLNETSMIKGLGFLSVGSNKKIFGIAAGNMVGHGSCPRVPSGWFGS